MRVFRSGGRWVHSGDERLEWVEGYSIDRRSLLARFCDHAKELWRVLFGNDDLT